MLEKTAIGEQIEKPLLQSAEMSQSGKSLGIGGSANGDLDSNEETTALLFSKEGADSEDQTQIMNLGQITQAQQVDEEHTQIYELYHQILA